MKRLVIIIISLAVLFLQVPVLAVDIQKDTVENKQPVKTDNNAVKSNNDTAGQQQQSTEIKIKQNKTDPAAKDFDSFIDKNNNGINDRAEKKTTESPGQTKTKK